MSLMDKVYDTREKYCLSCWLYIEEKNYYTLSPIEDKAPRQKSITLENIVAYYESLHPNERYVIHYKGTEIYSSFIPPAPTKHTNIKQEEPQQLSLW